MKKKIANARMAALAQVDRILDPDNGRATLENLTRAARVGGQQVKLELV
jgi:antitoxin HicB